MGPRLTLQEVADLCGVSCLTARNWIKQGLTAGIGAPRVKLHAVKMWGTHWFVERGDLDTFLAATYRTHLVSGGA